MSLVASFPNTCRVELLSVLVPRFHLVVGLFSEKFELDVSSLKSQVAGVAAFFYSKQAATHLIPLVAHSSNS